MHINDVTDLSEADFGTLGKKFEIGQAKKAQQYKQAGTAYAPSSVTYKMNQKSPVAAPSAQAAPTGTPEEIRKQKQAQAAKAAQLQMVAKPLAPKATQAPAQSQDSEQPAETPAVTQPKPVISADTVRKSLAALSVGQLMELKKIAAQRMGAKV